MNLLERYKKIQDTIAAAAAKARRSPSEITLIAVTKSASTDQIKQLVEAGHRDFGESRVQQLQQRTAQIDEWLSRQQQQRKAERPTEKVLPPPNGLRWHMVGHLQRNKVRPVLPLCRGGGGGIIHSVDSLRLAEEIQDEAARLAAQPPAPLPGSPASVVPASAPLPPTRILLEVNVAEEGSKFGVAVGAALHLAEQIDTMDDIQLVGLMCMAPFSANPEGARPVFARLRELFEEIRFRKIGGEKFRHLSMGMSGDYPVAIEEGATLVRVGTAVFG